MWSEFLAATGCKARVRALSQHTLAQARSAWPHGGPPTGFAFNGRLAWGDVHSGLAFDPVRATMEPPDWKHECPEDEQTALYAVGRPVGAAS